MLPEQHLPSKGGGEMLGDGLGVVVTPPQICRIRRG
jgi:hypothetical protein